MENYLNYMLYILLLILKNIVIDWQFNWGGYLLKCNGGVYKSNFNVHQYMKTCNKKNQID